MFGRMYHCVPVAPGRTVVEELKLRYESSSKISERVKNFLFYRLGIAYKYYVDRELELGSKSNEEYQRGYWSAYTEYYETKANEDYDTDYYRSFDHLFDRAVTEHGVRVCLDIGCGGFNQILRLKKKFPDLQFIGNDISTYSSQVYSSLKENGEVRFIPGSILNHAYLFEKIDLFYAFGVLMYLNELELEQFFTDIKRISRPIHGIIVDVFNDQAGLLTVTRDHHFLHNFMQYFKKFRFEVLEHTVRPHYAMAGEQILFAYFSTDTARAS